ncbi:hypothetical protein [Bosea vaviloviae]|uniref:Uncharacterized protein n=1 Tax=Bosea vaviloviae TaxID=1526658 RepID=A0A1D7U6T5_9HYPH|nr:hypothetical protein [Bosea vaviloviae]AOO83098.1 hypothetical protein BHK69_24020 [Bosea vaviloviae]
MAIDPSAQSAEQLSTLIQRYQERGLTDRAEYAAYVEAYAAKAVPKLKLDTTISAIREAARMKQFISYGDLASSNSVEWSSVRRLMPKHLDSILWKCHHLGWPLITAIVVNKQHLQTGAMEMESLAGFSEGARRLGVSVTDEPSFLQQQQKLTFDWASET